MGSMTDVWEWFGKPSSWAILLVLFIAWRIKTLLGVIAEELVLRRQRGIEHIIPAQGYKARLYTGEYDASDTRSATRRRAEDYEYLSIIAWGLKQDGSVTGFVHTADGMQQAETLDNFEMYITSEYAQELTEQARRIGEEDAVLLRLQHMGFYDGAMEDGLHTWKARAALRTFQESRGLPTTGKLDNATKQAIDLPLPVSYPVEVRLPTGLGLGEDATEAEVIRLLVREGDTVCVEQPLIEVETTLAVLEIPTPCDGVVLSLTVGEGETIQVGSVIAVIGPQGD